jgi:hypothetical protein
MNIIDYEDWASYSIDGVWDVVGLDLGCISCVGGNLTGQLRSYLVQHCTNKITIYSLVLTHSTDRTTSKSYQQTLVGLKTA